jgi:hypothetical protein
MKRIVIRRAMCNETVEIQWVRLDGSVYVERHTCPPQAVQDARAQDTTAETELLVGWADTREQAE